MVRNKAYGHSDPSRNLQPSQHRNTLRVQDALRAIEKDGPASKTEITKDDFLDFICSFPRLYRVGGVIGERLNRWLDQNQELVASWRPEIDQLQPGFFQSKEVDDRNGVRLPPAGQYVTREERGLPESFSPEPSQSKRPKVRKGSSPFEERQRRPRDQQTRVAHEKPSQASSDKVEEANEKPFGTPLSPRLAAVIASRSPRFAGLSLEQILEKTARFAAHDFGKIRDWFIQSAAGLEAGDPFVKTFQELAGKIPTFKEELKIAEMCVKSARAKEEERRKDEEEKQRRIEEKRANINVPVFSLELSHAQSSLTAGYGGDDEEEEEDDYGEYYPGGNPTPSKAPVPRPKEENPSVNADSRERIGISQLVHPPQSAAAESTETGTGTSGANKSSSMPPFPSDSSSLSSIPITKSPRPSRRASAEKARSQVIEDPADDSWDGEKTGKEAQEDPTDGNYRPRQSGKRKRKRTQKAIESVDFDFDSEH